ncbi:hypothetical protein CRG98_009137 [Punica granatum]|uniref:G-patch domain-containing protein n=1 Tax=Punica granatum TaxID=22663 RepID=A0A2I0KPR0_PUNGR|nr:hypothetical protein CRG98_009137 [Punica granatum]
MRLPSKFKILKFKTYEGTTDPRHHLRHYRGKMLQYWGYEEFVIHSFQDSLTGSALDWFMSLKAEDIPTWADLSRKFIDQYQPGKSLTWGSSSAGWRAPTGKGEESSKKVLAATSSSNGRRGKEVSVNAVNPAHPTPQQYSMNFATSPNCRSCLLPPASTASTPIGLLLGSTGPAANGLTTVRPPLRTRADFAQATGVESPSTSAAEPYFARSTGRRHAIPIPQAVHAPACSPFSHISTTPYGRSDSTDIPGPNFDLSVQDQSKRCEYHQGNPLPDHRPSLGPSINMITICTSGRDEDAQDNPLSFVIDYTPEEPTVGFAGHMASPTPFVVDIPAREPYSNNKVPWTYEESIGSVEQQFSVMGVTCSGRVYVNPAIRDKGKVPATEVGAVPESSPFPSKRVTEKEAKAFMKIIKAIEYKVPKETPPDRIEEIVGSIFSNTISFSDDELPSEGWTHSRALHIVCKCNNNTIGRVMIDNGSALKVCPVTTLKQMNVDLNRVRPSKTAVRAFDGSRREETAVPYISVGDDENLPFHSFETISIIRDCGEIGPSRADRMIGKVLLRNNYIPGIGLGARGQGISHPIEIEEYKHRRGLGFHPSCHEIVEACRENHLHRLAAHYGRLNRGIPVPPLSHFFPGPSHTIGGTLDGPSSDSEDTHVAPSAVYAVTEETPSRVHIRLALHPNPNPRHFDLNPFEEHLGEPQPIYFGEGLPEDSQVPEIEKSLRRLEDHQITSIEPTEEINVGTKEEPRTLKIGTTLDPAQQTRMIDFLREYQEVFAWSYADMPSLDPSIVEHFLPLDTKKFPPKRQQLLCAPEFNLVGARMR